MRFEKLFEDICFNVVSDDGGIWPLESSAIALLTIAVSFSFSCRQVYIGFIRGAVIIDSANPVLQIRKAAMRLRVYPKQHWSNLIPRVIVALQLSACVSIFIRTSGIRCHVVRKSIAFADLDLRLVGIDGTCGGVSGVNT